MKIRVLEALPSLRRAGAETVAVELACRLSPEQFETAVVSLYDPFPEGFEPTLAERGVRTRHLGKRRGFDPRMWPRLARTIREFAPDIIHTHSYLLRYVLPVAGPAEVVHTLHNMAGRDPDRLTALLNRFAFGRGTATVAVSAAVARSFETMYGFPPAATIPNGIDTARFRRPEARWRWREAHGFTGEDLLVTSVARLEPQKDPETLIRSFTLAARDRCYLLLAGDGSLREAMAALAAACGLDERIRFLGVCSDVAELLAASDVFALASRWEGNPVSVMEAMSAGLPVVATPVGGVPELVEDGVTGILTPVGDADALGHGLAALLDDPSRRRAMGQAARARAAGFDVQLMVEAYAELFSRHARRTP